MRNSNALIQAPYVGVTRRVPVGGRLEEVLAVMPENHSGDSEGNSPVLKFMNGLLVDDRMLNDGSSLGLLKECLIPDKRVLNVAHVHTTSKDLANVMLAVGAGNNELDGLQFNIPWPRPQEFIDYLDLDYACRCMILQIGGRALDEIDYDPSKMARRVREYNGLIKYVLIDPSDGQGKSFDAGFYRSFLDALYSESSRDYGVGISGGLRPGNLGAFRELAFEYPYLSSDAESGVQVGGNVSIPKAVDLVFETLSLQAESQSSLLR